MLEEDKSAWFDTVWFPTVCSQSINMTFPTSTMFTVKRADISMALQEALICKFIISMSPCCSLHRSRTCRYGVNIPVYQIVIVKHIMAFSLFTILLVIVIVRDGLHIWLLLQLLHVLICLCLSFCGWIVHYKDWIKLALWWFKGVKWWRLCQETFLKEMCLGHACMHFMHVKFTFHNIKWAQNVLTGNEKELNGVIE